MGTHTHTPSHKTHIELRQLLGFYIKRFLKSGLDILGLMEQILGDTHTHTHLLTKTHIELRQLLGFYNKRFLKSGLDILGLMDQILGDTHTHTPHHNRWRSASSTHTHKHTHTHTHT